MANGIFDNELILPGVITEIINDYISGYDTSEFGTTDVVTIVGTAFNGPIGVPVPVFSPEYAKYIFGEAFDASTRREATLIPEIYDAWERGCRSIFAVRLSGKEMFKDYEMVTQSNLKLRVSGQFPHNANKECFMLYKASQGSNSPGVIRIFKPADRTTMQEKLEGIVNDINSILVTEINLEDHGFTKSSRLVDLIEMVNRHESNNVLTLSIVDKDGIQITDADIVVQSLNIGDIFPGIYTLCRDKVGEDINPKTNIEIISSINNKPYKKFQAPVWKKLVINTDVKQPYPLFADDFMNFKAALKGIAADSNFDFLRKIGLLDRIAEKDDVDYEEVGIDPFEIYRKLGKGFVKNAKIEMKEKNGKVHYKVIQPDEDDPYRIAGISEGIYSILENHKTDFLVLAGISAETVITGKLPRKDDFKIINPGSISVLDSEGGDVILRANCKMDERDFRKEADYNITIQDINGMDKLEEILNQEKILNDISKHKFFRVPVISEDQVGVKFEGLNEDAMALAINTSDPNAGNRKGQLVKFNVDQKVFEKVEYDLLGLGEIGTPGYIAPKLLVQIGLELKAYKCETGDGVFVYDEEPTMFINEDGEIKHNNYIIASNGVNANIYYVPLNEDEAVMQTTNILRDIDDCIMTDDDNKNKTYDQGIDHILTCKLDAGSITPLISLNDLANCKLEEEEFTVAFAEKALPKLPCDGISENETFVSIFSNEMFFCSQEEMVEIFNNLDVIKDVIEFEITDSANALSELPAALNGSGLNRDPEMLYDTNKYIAFTTSDNFARHLAQHCLYTQLKTYPCHGIIGCSKLIGVNLSTIAQRVDEICNFNFDLFAKKDNGNYMYDSNNEPYPLGRCLSITNLQYVVNPGSEYNYISNGAAGYAGMVSALPVERSSTNQPINIPAMSYELSNYQLGRLNNKGIVCSKNAGNNVVIVDGITQAPKDSAFRRLSTSKTINAVDKVLRNAIEPFIGLVDSLTTRNSLNTAIKSALESLKGVIINDYKFRIYTDASGGNLGVIRADYVIVPYNEIREVRNRVEISDTL